MCLNRGTREQFLPTQDVSSQFIRAVLKAKSKYRKSRQAGSSNLDFVILCK
jgi:hypothetical protein